MVPKGKTTQSLFSGAPTGFSILHDTNPHKTTVRQGIEDYNEHFPSTHFVVTGNMSYLFC